MGVTVIEGNDAVFTCTANAQPRPEINWLKVRDNNTALTVSADDIQYNVIEVFSGQRLIKSILSILSVEPADGGTYRCVANNYIGIPAEAEALLTIIGTSQF